MPKVPKMPKIKSLNHEEHPELNKRTHLIGQANAIMHA
jgi:hypothetical protein